ncbi:hypothetical protein ACHAWF_011193 [Thalassiosira exigua]
MIISPSQAWSMLQRHADTDIKSLRLAELRSNDNAEAEGFVTAHRSTADAEDGDNDGHVIILDWSRQRMALDTIGHLLRLSAARQIRDRIRDLAWGRLAPGPRRQNAGTGHRSTGEHGDYIMSSPTVSFAHDLRGGSSSHYPNNHDEAVDGEEDGGSMHLALRAPANKGLKMHDPCADRMSKSTNALDEIHRGWKRIRALTDSLRQGTVRGASGRPLCDVLVVSSRGAVVPSALEFVYRALLQNDEAAMASLVDSSLTSVNLSHGAGAATSKGGESMASTLQSTAGGMINLVTTPFKSSRSIAKDLYGFTPPFDTISSSFRRRKLKVLTSHEPGSLKEVLTELSPETTMVVSLSLGRDGENTCRQITLAVRNWLLSGLVDADIGGSKDGGSDRNAMIEGIVQKHMFEVAGKHVKKANPNVFVVPKHSSCETFNTCSAGGVLPLSLVFGWSIASSFLSGAHDMDCHFVDTNPRHNLPILLALADLWNDAFLSSKGRILSPYTSAFASYPQFVAVLENRVLGGKSPTTIKSINNSRKERPSPVINGGNDIHQESCISRGAHTLSREFLTTMEQSGAPKTSDNDNGDSRMCSLLAHADTLAFGRINGSNSRGRFEVSSPGSPPAIQSVDSMLSNASNNCVGESKTTAGNQPSTLIILRTLDAFACGQLIALAEHRALVKAWLWDFNPFATGVSSIEIREERRENLMQNLKDIYNGKEEYLSDANAHNDDGVPPATRTILTNHATEMEKQRNTGSGFFASVSNQCM